MWKCERGKKSLAETYQSLFHDEEDENNDEGTVEEGRSDLRATETELKEDVGAPKPVYKPLDGERLPNTPLQLVS